MIPGVDIEAMRHMSADEARVHRNRMTFAAGNHPFGGPLRKPAGETCGSCRSCVVREEGRRYYKCGLNPRGWTKGPASDLRRKWPACSRWQRNGPEPPLEPPEHAPTLAGQDGPGFAPALSPRKPKRGPA